MAVSIRQYIDRLIAAKNSLIASRVDEVMKITLDVNALLKIRIQSRGEDYSGAKFEPYTPGYARTREKAGFQIAHVDLTRSGKTMASIMPVVQESSIFATVIIIQGADEQSRAIIRGLSKKRGDILRYSETELALARSANRQRILKHLQNLF